MIYTRLPVTGKDYGKQSFAISRYAVVSYIYGQPNSMLYELVANPANCTIQIKDEIALEMTERFNYGDSLLIQRPVANDVRYLLYESSPYFPRQLRYYDAMDEMAIVKTLLLDLKTASAYFKDKFPAALTATGPYAGKNASEILGAATEKDIIDFLISIVSRHRGYMGYDYKFIELYATWVQQNQPKGNLTKLKILDEYNKLIKMVLIKVNQQTGTLNGIPLKDAMNNWLRYFPVYDSDESGSPAGTNPYYGYYMLNNFLTF